MCDRGVPVSTASCCKVMLEEIPMVKGSGMVEPFFFNVSPQMPRIGVVEPGASVGRSKVTVVLLCLVLPPWMVLLLLAPLWRLLFWMMALLLVLLLGLLML